MAIRKTLGGDRLGSGNKMKVELHGYERSTHDMGYLWRSSMASGTLVPFLCEIGLSGDTFDISLNSDFKTLPTVGPLFGSYKVQMDVFMCPIRLYNSLLHNNALGIGLKMDKVKLPALELSAPAYAETSEIDNSQINPSCILSYLGIRGVGTTEAARTRTFNGTALLAYWDIYKQYYANKMEEIGAVLHTPNEPIVQTATAVIVTTAGVETGIPVVPSTPVQKAMAQGSTITIHSQLASAPPKPYQILMNLEGVGPVSIEELCLSFVTTDDGTTRYITGTYDYGKYGLQYAQTVQYATPSTQTQAPRVATFDLNNIDEMRKRILAFSSETVPFDIKAQNLEPYVWVTESPNGVPNMLSSQEGLALKTFQSDLFNNWMKTDMFDGVEGISAITAIDTSGGSFTIDTLNLSKKVYNMLNRIAVSGGTYDDWLDAVYTHDRYTRAESPVYMGGLMKDISFQEVVSNTRTPSQPLGTLAGRGVQGARHKGGNVVVKVDEPCYIIGLVSITPRIDYSQGNKWDVGLTTMNDLHKPQLDEIGFQDLITEQMAWWDTNYDETAGKWVQKSAGKQPAWINYMTNVNQCRGNFAVENMEMFMTLNRRFEHEIDGVTQLPKIKDLTTYIDPSKFNFIFADVTTDAQNFWAQIAVDITARRKMSAKVMPNL